jgi:uncharacterized protein YxjI
MRYIIREKLLSFGQDSIIKNEVGQPVFDVDGKALSLTNTLIVSDMEGNKLVTIKQKLPALTPTYEITREGQESSKISKQLISPFADRFKVDIPGPDDLNIKGSTAEHEYTMTRGEQVIATVSKGWFEELETYGVDIAPDQDDELILACVLVLDFIGS